MVCRIAVASLLALGAAGCALTSTARDTFARRFSCPPEQVQVTPRTDVLPHVALVTETAVPPAEVAQDPVRLRYFQEQEAKKLADVDASYRSVYEAVGCGHKSFLACQPGGADEDSSCDVSPTGGASGEIVSSGGSGGDWKLAVAGCRRPVGDEHGHAVTVLIGKDGLRIGFAVGDGFIAVQNLTRADSPQIFLKTSSFGWDFGDYVCSTRSGDAKLRTSGMVAGIDGSLTFSCATKDGAQVRGHLQLSSCP
jgi:hypothetical protein